MPNWCTNTITFKHDDPLKIYEIIHNTNGLFQHFIPCPQELLDQPSPPSSENMAELNRLSYGAKDWYDWCCDNWGVKWDADVEEVIRVSDNEVEVQCLTAWGPPLGALGTMLSMGYRIKCEFYDECLEFHGGWDNGEEYYTEPPWDDSEEEELV